MEDSSPVSPLVGMCPKAVSLCLNKVRTHWHSPESIDIRHSLAHCRQRNPLLNSHAHDIPETSLPSVHTVHEEGIHHQILKRSIFLKRPCNIIQKLCLYDTAGTEN